MRDPAIAGLAGLIVLGAAIAAPDYALRLWIGATAAGTIIGHIIGMVMIATITRRRAS